MAEKGRARRIDEIGEESRRRIMDAAEELFAEKGYDRTSFVDIAERSGISRGSIPWHFENKDGLLIAVVERAIGRVIPDDSFTTFDTEGLREVFERVKEWMHHPSAALTFMVLNEALSTDGRVHDQYVQYFRDRRHGIKLLLGASAGKTHLTKADLAALEPAAAVIHGALLGLSLQHQLDPTLDLDAGIDVLDEIMENMIKTVARGPVKSARTVTGRSRQPASSRSR